LIDFNSLPSTQIKSGYGNQVKRHVMWDKLAYVLTSGAVIWIRGPQWSIRPCFYLIKCCRIICLALRIQQPISKIWIRIFTNFYRFTDPFCLFVFFIGNHWLHEKIVKNSGYFFNFAFFLDNFLVK
jgi:hypothetical protein